MRLSQKLGKVLSGDALESAKRRVRKMRVRRPIGSEVARLMQTIDRARFDEIAAKYSVPDPGHTPLKYVQLEHWLRINLQRIRDIDLDRAKPKRVLDIGCGAGYFLYIAKQYGHDVLGLDIDTFPLFAETTEFLGVPRVIWRIEPFVRLPDLGRKFDLISAHMICFNGHRTDSWWGVPEWEFFFDDLASHMNPKGRVQFAFNREPNGLLYTLELKRYFQSRGATIHGVAVVFEPLRPARQRSATLAERGGSG
ncbi:MAG: class I SAM-dependent methyltransferase [Chthoniobacterales bacterium]